MTDCIAIRTHRWDEEEERLLAALQPVFGEHVVIAFHNRPEDVTPPVRVADFNDDWVRDNGLRPLEDYGWRCGDYALYALRQAFPGYDRYWLIEPDVAIFGDIAGFFAGADRLDHDGLGVDFEAQERGENRFTKGLVKLAPHRATFALTRFSGRAIDRLFALRQEYSASEIGRWRFTNDETFCFSHLVADPEMTVGGFAELMPEWFAMGFFDTDPDLLDHALADAVGSSNQICHPVRRIETYIPAVSQRVAENAAGFMRQMRLSLKGMSEAEIEALGQAAKERLIAVAMQLREES